MRLRQVALVARKLAPVVDDLTAVLGIEVAFNDPGVGRYGLENAVMPIGDTFLEVVAPTRPAAAGGRYLERRGGDGGYMVILQADDALAERARVEGMGIRVVERIDRPGAVGSHLHPKDTGGAILSIDGMEPPQEWQWAGPSWREHVRTDSSLAITGVELQSPDPAALARRWAEILQQQAERAERGEWRVRLPGGGLLRFVEATDGRGEGVSGVDLAVRDVAAIVARAKQRGLPTGDDSVMLCGTRFRLRQTLRMRSLALPGIEEYAEAHTTLPPAHLGAIELETVARSAAPQMMVGPLEGRLLKMLVHMVQPRSVLEIGTFTGYSSLSMAEALPSDGSITTLDINPLHAEIARRHIAASPYAGRIEVVLGPALQSLRDLPGPFDLVFIDADKGNYLNYYEAVLPKLSPRGVIAVDNVLWSGSVLDPAPTEEDTLAIKAFNRHVANDPRVECVMLTVRDGLFLIRNR